MRAPPVVPTLVPVAARPRAQYVPRKLYLAGVRPALPAGPLSNLTVEGGATSTPMATHFSQPPTATACAWQAACLFYTCAGFFRDAANASIPPARMEDCFADAISKRRTTVKTRREVDGRTSAYVAFANSASAPFTGGTALFPLTVYLKSLWVRGRTVAWYARWRLKVFDEILSLELPPEPPSRDCCRQP